MDEAQLIKKREKFFSKTLPKIYKRGIKRPVLKNKVIFVCGYGKRRFENFDYLKYYLEKKGGYDIHIYSLKTRIDNERSAADAKKLVADMADASLIFTDKASEVLSALDIRKETALIHLWNDTGVFKNISNTQNDSIADDRQTYGNIDVLSCCDEKFSKTIREGLAIKDDGVVCPLGISRSDAYLDKSFIEESYKKFYSIFQNAQGKKIIYYAPMSRKRQGEIKFPSRFSIQFMHYVFKDDYVIAISRDRLSLPPRTIQEKYYDFAKDITGQMTSTQMLSICDIFITDYSPLVFDAAFAAKPTIMFQYDAHRYKDRMNTFLNFDEYSIGPICECNEDIVNYIKDNENDFDISSLLRFKEKYMSACDGHSTERIIDRALEILNER